MITAVFLDTGTVDRGDIDWTPLEYEDITWRLHESTGDEQIAERIAPAQIIVTNKVVLTRRHLRQAPELRFVCIAATGTNNVDTGAAGSLGIVVSNVVRYATPSVVQHVFTLILALTTHLAEYRELAAGGAWQRSPGFCLLDHPIRELAGKTLGIVGLGELGRATAAIAECFGMDVLVARRPGGPHLAGRVHLNELLPRVDILSLHCPLTEATRNLIGAAELRQMKPDALLINIARGGLVNEQALADALRDGIIGGAGVDVLSEEPPRRGNPLLAPDIPNLIVTPHIAWASRDARQRLVEEIARNITAFLQGNPRNRIV